MTIERNPSLLLRRSYPHSRERVFEAFAQADALAMWLAPSPNIKTQVCGLEFAVGGSYRFKFTLPDGNDAYVVGQYLAIERPERLSFSWNWEPPDAHAGIESVVTVTFANKSGETEVTLAHEMLTAAGMKARHTQGWNAALSRLAHSLSQWQPAHHS